MRFALLIFGVAGTLWAAPVLDERGPKATTVIECSRSRFQQGTTFEYEYAGETINTVAGATEQATGMQLTASILITQLKGCEFHMRLRGIGLRSKTMNGDWKKSAESTAFGKSLENNDVIFTMDGTKITGIQSHVSETTEAVNIKRGILSTLQLDQTGSETDVHGICDTKVEKIDGTIIKTKQLTACSKRAQNEIGIQSASIKTGSDLKPLDSKSTCTYTMDAMTIRTASCVETHLFRPFSAGYESNTGAMTIVKQKMRFISYKVGNSDAAPQGGNYEKRSLIFDHTTEDNKQAGSLIDQVEDVMSRLIDQSHLSVKSTSAHEFTSLVMLFRKLSQNKMLFVWEKYFDCQASKVCGNQDMNLKDLYRQYMLDAIAYCGTAECVSVVKDVTISGEVAGERANMFLQSIALVAKTTNGMIEDVLDIVKKKPSRQAFMTLGTVISRHCAKSPAECKTSDSPAANAGKFLETTLGDCSGEDHYERAEEILMVLKAIGNAKGPASARKSLLKCGQSSIHANVTMAAFDALRGMACDKTTMENLIALIGDKKIASEKRIYAFQASMKCPTRDNINALVALFNSEEDTQLTSFMWSFFTNILESNDPTMKEAKEVLSAVTKETPLKDASYPLFSHSQNFEKSLYLESIKTGVSTKANLVYDNEGILPKTAVIDVTAEVMGVPVNLVETAIGVDGVESLLENLVMPDNFITNMFDWKAKSERIKKLKAQAKSKKPSHPSGFMNLKVMGQDVRVMSYDDIYAMINEVDNMNVIQLMTKVAKGGQKTFSKSMMFLEMTHTVPTGFGLPLKLKLTGTTVGTVELAGKFDIRNMFWGPGAMSIKGSIKPTAVVEVAGKMGTESEFLSSGLMVSSNMIVSNMLKGSIDYKSGQIFKVNLDTPEEPVQLFKFSSTPYMYLNTQSDIIEGTPRVINTTECYKSELAGYGLCASVRVPLAYRNYESPYFPLSGPAHFGMTLVRGDEKLTTFQFLTTMTKTTTGMAGVIEFSAPGALYERKFHGKIAYNHIADDKIFTLSAEPLGRTASIELIYNTFTRRSSFITKNNIFGKSMVTRLVYFNQTNLVSQQYGIQATAQYDSYKAEHVSRLVAKPTGLQLLSKTTYAPNKAVTSSLAYDTKEKTVSANFDINQLKQAVELTGKWENIDGRTGVSVNAIHKPSGKAAKFFTGYSGEEGKKELASSLTVLDNTFYNILGFYNNNGVLKIEDSLVLNGKSAKFVAAIDNNKKVTFSADVFGKKASSVVLYSDLGDKKTIEVAVEALDKKASSSIVLTNTESEKTLKLIVEALGKKAEATVGYYDSNAITIFKLQADILGKHAEVFWQVDKNNGFKSTVGGKFDVYSAGATGSYTRGVGMSRDLCSYVYYGKGNATKQPLKACINLVDLSDAQTMKLKLVKFCEVGSQKFSSECTFLKEAGHVQHIWEVKHNEDTKMETELDVDYKDPANSAVNFLFTAGFVQGGVKAYTKKVKETTDYGVQLFGMGNTILFLNQYQETVVPEAKDMKVTSTVVLNEKTLPFSTVVSYMLGKGVAGPTVAINVGTYSLVHSTKYMYAEKYGFSSETMLLKEEKLMYKCFNEIIATISQKARKLEHTVGFSVMGKTYKYGWAVGHENQSNEKRMQHVFYGKLQYATGRFSTSIATLTNTPEEASLVVECEYFPMNKVQSSIRYNKKVQQLDVSVELLPEIFVTLMSRLDKKEGYSVVTSLGLKYKKVSRSITVKNSFLNDDKEIVVSTSLSKDTFVTVKFNKAAKSLTFISSAGGVRVELMGQIRPLGARILVVRDGKVIINWSLGWAKIINALKKEFNLAYDKSVKFSKLEYKKFMEICQRAINELMTLYKGESQRYNTALSEFREKVKNWMRFDVDETKSSHVVKVYVMGKRYSKIIIKKKSPIVAVQLPNHVSLSAKYHPKSKSLSLTLKTRKTKATLSFRLDVAQKVGAVQFFMNKKQVGLKVFIEKNSLICKLIVNPKLILKTIFTVTDNALTMLVQRNNVDESKMHFSLSNNITGLVLKWNTETLKKLESIVAQLTTEAKLKAEQLKEVTKEVRVEILKALKKMEKDLAQFDFRAAGKKVGVATLEGLKKISGLTSESFNKLATIFEKIKKAMPEVIQKIKDLINEAKVIVQKLKSDVKIGKKELIAKMKVLVQKIKEMIKKGLKVVGKVRVSVEKEIATLKVVLTKVAANLTEAIRPVIKTANQLLKDFKIRGIRLEDMAKEMATKGETIAKMAVDKVAVATEQLREQTIQILREIKARMIESSKQILKLKVPFTQKTVAQVIEIIKKVVTDLKGKIASLDLKKTIETITRKIMDHKINGKTVKEYITIAQKKVQEVRELIKTLTEKYMETLKTLPKSTRAALRTLIKMSRSYIKDIEVYVQRIEKFLKPIAKYLEVVKASIAKHFNPIYKELVLSITKRLHKIKLPELEPIIVAKVKEVVELAAPVLKLSKNILEQIGNITVVGLKVGPMMDKQIEKIVSMLETLADQVKVKMSVQLKQSLDKIVKVYNKVKAETPEELVDSAITKTIVVYKDVIAYLNKLYKENEIDTAKVIKEFQILYQKLKVEYERLMAKYQELTSKSINELAEEIMIVSSKKFMKHTETISNIVMQASGMDLTKPMNQVWNEADVLGRLAKYGANEKIMNAIKTVKELNITESALRTIERVQKIIKDDLMKSYRAALEVYKKVQEVIAYLKSIGNKDYATWVAELRVATVGNRKKIMAFLNKAYKASSDEVLTAIKGLEKFAKEEHVKITTLGNGYITVLKKWSTLIASKAKLVYSDIKPETVAIYQHYRDIISTFTKSKYAIVKTKLIAEFNRIVAQLTKEIEVLKVKAKGKVTELIRLLKEKIAELMLKLEQKYIETRGKIEKAYVEMVSRYGNMTWEQIQEKLETASGEIYEKVKMQATREYERIMKETLALRNEIVGKVKDAYVKSTGEFKKMIDTVRKEGLRMRELITKLKRKVIEIVRKIEGLARMEVEKVIGKITVVCDDIKRACLHVYNMNKDKTLKQIFTEIKKMILHRFGNYRQLVQTIGEKNAAKVTQLLSKANTASAEYMTRIGHFITKVIIPAMIEEMESIINQTLRSTVTLSKEVIQACSPGARIAEEACVKFVNYMIVEVSRIVREVEASIMEEIAVVRKLFNDNISKLNMKIRELLGMLMKHKKVIAVQEKLVEIRKFIEGKIEELKPVIDKLVKTIQEKIEIVKEKPAVAEVIKAAQKKLAELQKLAQSYKQTLDQLYTKVGRAVETATKLAKQIKTSGTFTGRKLAETIEQTAQSAITRTKQELQAMKKMAGTFVDAPEETFWKGVGQLKQTIMHTRMRSVSEIIDTCRQLLKDAVVIAEQTIIKSTDKWTQETAKKVFAQMKALLSKLQSKLATVMGDWVKIPAMVKALLEKEFKVVKAIVERQVELVKEFIAKNLRSVKAMAERVTESIKKCYDNSLLEAIVDNRLWKELAQEIKNHELVALGKEIAQIARVKIEKLIVILEERLAEIRVKVLEKIAEIKEVVKMTVEIARGIVARTIVRVRQLVKKVWEEMTIADFVDSIRKAAVQAVQVAEEIKGKLIAVMEKYTVSARAVIAKLEQQIRKIIDAVRRVIDTASKRLAADMEPIIAKIVATYQKYLPIVKEGLKKVETYVMTRLRTVKVVAEKTLFEIVDRAYKLYNKYQAIVVKTIKAIEKRILEVTGIKEKLATLKKMTVMETLKALTNVHKVVIEKVRKLAKKMEELVKKVISKFAPAYKDLVEKLNLQKQMLIENLKIQKQMLLGNLTLQKKMLMMKVKPYMTEIEKFLRPVVAEIKETALFVYQYYHLQAKYNNAEAYAIKTMDETIMKCNIARRYVTIETKKMLKDAKATIATSTIRAEKLYKQVKAFLETEVVRMIKELPELASTLKKYAAISEQVLKKFAAEYGNNFSKCMTTCIKKANKFAAKYAAEMEPLLKNAVAKMEKAAWKAGDKTLRTIHSTLKYLSTVKITLTNGQLDLTFIHKDLIPTLKKQINMLKNILSLEQLKLKGKQLLKKIEKAVRKVIKKVKAEYPGMVAKAVAVVKKDCAAMMEKAKGLITDLKKSEKLIAMKEKLIEIKKFIQAKIAEFEKNPVLVKAKAQAQEMIKKLEKVLDTIRKRVPLIPAEIKETVEKMMKTAPLLVKKSREYLIKRIEEVKEKLLAMEEKVKTTIIKITDNGKFKKVIAIVKAKVAAMKRWIKEKVEELKNNPVVVKMEKRAGELIKKAEEIIKKMKAFAKQLPEVITKRATEIVETGKAKAKELIAKLEKRLKELVETIKKSKIVGDVKQKIAELKKWIQAKIAELKKNPTLLRTKAQIEKVIKTLKEKLPEVITKANVMIKKYIKLVKEQAPKLIKKYDEMIRKYIKLAKEQAPKLIKKYVETIKKQRAVAIAKAKEALRWIAGKVEEFKKHPTVLQAVKMIGETVKKIESQIATIKANIPEIIKKLKVLLKKIGEKVKVVLPRIEKELRELASKVEAKAKEVLPKLREMIEKIKKSETVAKIQKKIVELKKWIEAKLKEIREHPTVAKIENEIKKILTTVKTQGPKIVAKVKAEVEKIKQQVKGQVEKVKQLIKKYIDLAKARAPVLVKTVREILARKVKEVKMVVAQLVKQIRSKIEESKQIIRTKIQELKQTIRTKIEELKKNPIVLKLKAKIMQIVKKIEEIMGSLEKKIKEQAPIVIARARRSIDAIAQRITKERASVEEKVKSYIPKIEQKLKDLVSTIKKTKEFVAVEQKVAEIRKWLVTKLQELNVNTADLQKDILKVYNINKVLAIRLYKDAEVVAVKYYKSLKQDATAFIKTSKIVSEASVKKFVKLSEEAYAEAIKLYRFASNSTIAEIYSKTMTYTKEYFNTLKQNVTEYYTDFKPIVEMILKDFAVRLMSVKTTFDEIIAGMPLKQVLKPLLEEARLIVKELKSLVKSISFDISQGVCNKDTELCKLARQVVKLYRELIRKYTGEVIVMGKLN